VGGFSTCPATTKAVYRKGSPVSAYRIPTETVNGLSLALEVSRDSGGVFGGDLVKLAVSERDHHHASTWLTAVQALILASALIQTATQIIESADWVEE
jgi:hypothetical protein